MKLEDFERPVVGACVQGELDRRVLDRRQGAGQERHERGLGLSHDERLANGRGRCRLCLRNGGGRGRGGAPAREPQHEGRGEAVPQVVTRRGIRHARTITRDLLRN